jgi:Fic family protein
MKPPYHITPAILQLIAGISEKMGEINAAHLYRPSAELRKTNRIKTIQSSLEIEGNSLTVAQITDILGNKRVKGPRKDILEVKNAIAVYNRLNEFKPYSLPSLLKAHSILMEGLVPSPGKIRSKPVGIVKGSKVTHIAPSGSLVKPQLNNLFDYVKKDKDLLLIKSCVFHYEFEFIHPFTDGNGRMGRLWQTILLKQRYPVFEFLPVETLIKKKQTEYYNALNKSDLAGHSTFFIEFMLRIILASLEELLATQSLSRSATDRIDLFRINHGTAPFTRKDYLRSFKEIAPATASRDLKEAVKKGILKKEGDKRTATYSFK